MSSPSTPAIQLLYLTSVEQTSWATLRRCTPLEVVHGPANVNALLVRLDVPTSDDETIVILAPRYEGDDLLSISSPPGVWVNIFAAASDNEGKAKPWLPRLIGVGEVHTSEREAQDRSLIGLQW